MVRGHWSNQYGNSNLRYDLHGRGYPDDTRNMSEAGFTSQRRSGKFPSPGRGYVPFGAYDEDRGDAMSPDIIPSCRRPFEWID
jgi:hypothetical protein